MTVKSKKTGPRKETLERRKAILRAAADVFGAKGYNNGPLAEIAEQVGMTHAGILHHFGSKNHLLVEVLKYRDESDVQDKDGNHIPDGEELFKHLIHTAVLNETRPGLVQAYAVLSAESVTEGHPGREYFVGRYRVLREEIRQAFLGMCADLGVEANERIDSTSYAILAVMDGLQVQWLLDHDNVNLAVTTRTAIEALVSQAIGRPWSA